MARRSLKFNAEIIMQNAETISNAEMIMQNAEMDKITRRIAVENYFIIKLFLHFALLFLH